MGTSQVLHPSFSYEHRPSGIQPEQAMNYIDNFAHFRTSLEFELSKAHAFIIVENYYNTETVEQFVMFTLCKVARKTHVHTLRRFDEFFKKHHCKV